MDNPVAQPDLATLVAFCVDQRYSLEKTLAVLSAAGVHATREEVSEHWSSRTRPLEELCDQAKLSRRQREALVLLFSEGLSPQDAAAQMGVDESTLHVHVHRAKKRLKELWFLFEEEEALARETTRLTVTSWALDRYLSGDEQYWELYEAIEELAESHPQLKQLLALWAEVFEEDERSPTLKELDRLIYALAAETSPEMRRMVQAVTVWTDLGVNSPDEFYDWEAFELRRAIKKAGPEVARVCVWLDHQWRTRFWRTRREPTSGSTCRTEGAIGDAPEGGAE